MRAIWARRRRHRGWGRGWGHPSRLRTNRSENFVRLPACAGACRNPIWIAACVAGRQPLHVGACPRKLAGQANFALHTAHTRRGIVPRGASLSETFSVLLPEKVRASSRHKLLVEHKQVETVYSFPHFLKGGRERSGAHFDPLAALSRRRKLLPPRRERARGAHGRGPGRRAARSLRQAGARA